MTHNLEDVFKLSGVPTLTFVEPVEYSRLKIALRTPGRGVVVEGPSKIGKTSAVTNALDAIGASAEVVKLSARRSEDVDLIRELPNMKAIGVVVIDDFHRLDAESKSAISDFMKILADEERTDSKVVVIGINKAGESLISIAPDLGGRIEIVKLGINPEDRLESLIEKGEAALNISIDAKHEIARSALGSFNIAQALCHDACLTKDVEETQVEKAVVDASFELIRERVLDRLSGTFQRRAEIFAKGKKLRREGRAPYLQILRWLSQSDEWTIELDREMSRNPTLRPSVSQVVEKGHLRNLLDEKHDVLSDLVHYEEDGRILAVEDPQFFFYIKHLSWNRFAERLGYFEVSFASTYDYALSFAGSDREIAKMLYTKLAERELGIFYDENEQSRILAANVEEYLAPIYKSEASYIVVFLGNDYPKRVWTRFESEQFRHRFGDNAVIPIWFADVDYSVFDESRDFGGMTFDRSKPMEAQVELFAENLAQRLANDRAEAAARGARDAASAVAED
ncbi:AAA family ATPase [Microbacterium sp. WHRI 7836]|uniref:AAA family ATPase n=1 Tax=Microbacterium sp. WHRI 7836 TaxID=3162563 RepID=UPI0032ED212B